MEAAWPRPIACVAGGGKSKALLEALAGREAELDRLAGEIAQIADNRGHGERLLTVARRKLLELGKIFADVVARCLPPTAELRAALAGLIAEARLLTDPAGRSAWA